MAWQVVRVEEKWILKDAREKLGLTQQQVATKARIQLRQYQRFEDGERELSSAAFYTACGVMEALELDPSKYFHGDYVLCDAAESTLNGI